MTIHATCVARDGAGVLLVGPPGAGKSDLALRLIDRGWMLVADDRVELAAEAGSAVARPPCTIAGKLEVRGVGIVELPYLRQAAVVLAADLGAVPERMPVLVTRLFAGVALPLIAVEPFAASAVLKIELAWTRTRDPLQNLNA